MNFFGGGGGGADENNSNISGNGCEDSVGETCLVSCGDMWSAFRKQDRDRPPKENNVLRMWV